MKWIISALITFSTSISFAVDLPAPASTPAAPSAVNIEVQNSQKGAKMLGSPPNGNGGAPKVIRKKELNFEGRGVEVLLGKDYESLSQTGTVEPANREKLYKTRLFMNESENLLQELEYSR